MWCFQKISIVPDNGIAWRVWLVRIHTLNRNEGCERRSNCRFVTIQHLALFATLYFFHACVRVSECFIFICTIAFKLPPIHLCYFFGRGWMQIISVTVWNAFLIFSTIYGPAIIWYEHVMVVVSWEKTGLESSFFFQFSSTTSIPVRANANVCIRSDSKCKCARTAAAVWFKRN